MVKRFRIFIYKLLFALPAVTSTHVFADPETCSNLLKGLAPETSPANTLILTYDRGYFADTLLEIQKNVDTNINVVVVVVDNDSFANDPKIFEKFKHQKNVTFVESRGYQGSVWTRDWVPQKVTRRDGSVQYVNLRYYATDNNHLAPSQFAETFKLQHYESWIEGEMGNVMTDGNGKLFITNKILVDNLNERKRITREEIILELKKAFEVDEVHIVPQHPRDGGIGHIDLVAKYIGNVRGKRTVLVSDSIRSDVKKKLDEAADLFHSLGFHVVRIEEFEEKIGRGAVGFVNSLILNETVFMPIYSKGFKSPPQRLLELEDNARRTYEQFGFRVIPINSYQAIHGMGAVHCLTCTMNIEER